eukprot:gene8675-9558_t
MDVACVGSSRLSWLAVLRRCAFPQPPPVALTSLKTPFHRWLLSREASLQTLTISLGDVGELDHLSSSWLPQITTVTIVNDDDDIMLPARMTRKKKGKKKDVEQVCKALAIFLDSCRLLSVELKSSSVPVDQWLAMLSAQRETLRHLRLDVQGASDKVLDAVGSLSGSQLRCLSLDVKEWSGLDSSCLLHFLQRHGQCLEDLQLTMLPLSFQLSEAGVSDILLACPRLINLTLLHHPKVSLDGSNPRGTRRTWIKSEGRVFFSLLPFFKQYPQLRVLDLTGLAVLINDAKRSVVVFCQGQLSSEEFKVFMSMEDCCQRPGYALQTYRC